MNRRATVLGITGNSGSGKSSLCEALASWGATVIDADVIAKKLQEPGAPGYKAILTAFGEEYRLPDGALDRRKLAALVFTCEDSLKKLNAIMHPMIIDDIIRRISAIEGVAVIDAPLLFETKLDAVCDEVWLITAPFETRVQRIMERDGISRAEAEMRVKSQAPVDPDKVDLVLENVGDPGAFAQSIRPYYSRLIKD